MSELEKPNDVNSYAIHIPVYPQYTIIFVA